MDQPGYDYHIDIPGTTLFDGRMAMKGYQLNKMCYDFNRAENRDASARAVDGIVGHLREALARVRSELHGVPRPLAPEGADLASLLVPERIPSQWGSVREASVALLESHDSLHRQLLGRLAVAAEEVETACGLAPLTAS